ncbi:MAG: hypothetical protein H7326_09000 [Bdellovibrionaceae bacterium]|nr:hypothetical protein [Pseudobdellovibrionaceae bacterium]
MGYTMWMAVILFSSSVWAQVVANEQTLVLENKSAASSPSSVIEKTVRLSNVGTSTLQPIISNGCKAPVKLASGCFSPLAPRSTCKLTVSLKPGEFNPGLHCALKFRAQNEEGETISSGSISITTADDSERKL